MDSFEINKIIAAVIVTVLIVIGISKISDFMFHVDKPQMAAYKVEAMDSDGNVSLATTESDVDISALLALGSVEHGQKVFKKCKACQSRCGGGWSGG